MYRQASRWTALWFAALLLWGSAMNGSGTTLAAASADPAQTVASTMAATFPCTNYTGSSLSYIVNKDNYCIELGGIDRAAASKASIYTWKTGATVNPKNAYGVALYIDNGVLVKYVDFNGKEYTTQNPAGVTLPDGPNYATKDLTIPDNGYIIYVPNPSLDEQSRDLRKIVLGTFPGVTESFVAPNLLGEPVSLFNLQVDPKPDEQPTTLVDERISNGIGYMEKDIRFFGRKNIRQRLNQLTVDLADPDTSVLISKASDRVVAKETVGRQIERETVRGRRVVAGMNADMFGVQTGINYGLQVQDGHLLVNHTTPASADVSPAFFVDSAGKPHIDKLAMKGTLTADTASMPIDNLNRNENVNNRIVLYTPSFSKTGKVAFDAAATYADTSAYVIVTGISQPENLAAGKAITGQVSLIGDNVRGLDIPADGVVIAAFGTQAAWLRANTAKDQPISYQFDLYQGEGATPALNNDIVQAVSSYSWLVKDGKALTSAEMLAKGYADTLVNTANARSAIGLTADGRIIAVTVDKASAQFNDSDGVTLPDLAAYMSSQGAIAAINLDGGGSTEMLVRRSGSDRAATVNHPSDGSSREVTNSILFTSGALPVADVGTVIVDKPISIFKGSSYTFGYRVTDKNGNPFQQGLKKGSFSTDNGVIDETGHYTAPDQAGTGSVSVKVDDVTGNAAISIVDHVASLAYVQQGDIILQPGDVRSFALSALDDAGKPVIMDPSAADWSLDPALGEVNDQGQVTIKASSGTGTLSVTLGGKTAAATIIVGLKEKMIDDFETFDLSGYHLAGYMFGNATLYGSSTSSNPSKSTQIKHAGANSLKVDYNSAAWARTFNGTINIVPHWYYATGAAAGKWTNALADEMYKTYTTEVRPKKFAMWVYGDGKAPWLRSIFKTGGQNKTLDIAPKVDWVGWKYVEVPIPQDWALPITLNYLYAVEVDKLIPNYSGTFYLDDLKYIYTDEQQDFSGPAFSDTLPASDNVYTGTFNVTTTIRDEQSGLKPGSLVVKLNNQDYDKYTFDPATGKLSIALRDLAAGDYQLLVEATDMAGNVSVPNIDRTFHVDLSPDTQAPVLSDWTPSADVTVRTPVPRITFRLRDAKSGMQASDISMKLDGKPLTATYDAATGWGYAMPEAPLTDGPHTLELNAKDRAGNLLQQSQSFTLQALPQPSNPDQFNISIIPDTQGNAFTEQIYKKVAAENTELVLHVGDITDTAMQDDYDAGRGYVDRFIQKPFFVIPGNHEAFRNTLDIFYKLFGMPTFHFDFGNTLIIGLNSAYGQSIDASDSTQYEYLQRLLDENKQRNVLILNHVMTKDDFGTKHEMAPAEAEKFEQILSKYKAKHPAVDVQVLFGHLHTLQQWKKDGVTYTITGNAANKAYVSHDNGDILGSGILKVSSAGMNYTYAPLVRSVYVSNSGLQQGKMNLVQGASAKLDLYGDFSVYPSSYIQNISQFPLINMEWTSDNPDAVTVDQTGMIRAVSAGTAHITATSGGKSHTVTIETVGQETVKPVKLQLNAAGKMETYASQLPSLIATDAFGRTYTLNTGHVQKWTFKHGLLIWNDKLERLESSNKTGTEELRATYNGLTAAATVEVYAPATSGPIGGGTPTPPPAPDRPVLDIKSTSSAVIATLQAEIVKGSSPTSRTTASISEEWFTKALDAFSKEPSKQAAMNIVAEDSAVGKPSEVQLELPAKSLAELITAAGKAAQQTTTPVLTVKTALGKAAFNQDALQALASMQEGPTTVLTMKQKPAAAGERSVYELLAANGKEQVEDLGKGWATLSIPYTLAPGENPQAVVVYAVQEGHAPKLVTNGSYDVKSGTIQFRVNRLSAFEIQHRSVVFQDVKNSYAQDDITYLAARQIIQGNGAGLFSPKSSVTRADFAMMLAKMAGANSNTASTGGSGSIYPDVKPTAYYVAAVTWASKAGIVTGTGDGRFLPENPITRAEMAVMITRFAKAVSFKLPVIADAEAFLDEANIPAYAEDASTALQQAGIVTGKPVPGNQGAAFAPHSSSQRQEAAAMLARLLRMMGQ